MCDASHIKFEFNLILNAIDTEDLQASPVIIPKLYVLYVSYDMRIKN